MPEGFNMGLGPQINNTMGTSAAQDPMYGQQPPLYISPYAGQYTDSNSAPIMPDFNQIYSNSQALEPQMQNLLAGANYNQQPLQQLQQNAENPNPSPWAQLQSQLAHQQTNQAMSQAAGQTAGQTAQAQGNLALSGGLSSGANERTQEAGQQAGIGAQQSAQNQGNQAQTQIGISDAANKQQEMMALPGMEAQSYQTQLEPIQMQGQAMAQDLADQMANAQAANQFNMAAYGNQAGMYGANQTANAQEQAAQNTSGLLGGGGTLGLGLGSIGQAGSGPVGDLTSPGSWFNNWNF